MGDLRLPTWLETALVATLSGLELAVHSSARGWTKYGRGVLKADAIKLPVFDSNEASALVPTLPLPAGVTVPPGASAHEPVTSFSPGLCAAWFRL